MLTASNNPEVSVTNSGDKYLWMSPYVYCVNNPLRYIDLFGLDWIPPNSSGNETDDWIWSMEPVIVWGYIPGYEFLMKFDEGSENGDNGEITFKDRVRYTYYKLFEYRGADLHESIPYFVGAVWGTPLVVAGLEYSLTVGSPALVDLIIKYGPELTYLGIKSAKELKFWIERVGYDKFIKMLDYGTKISHRFINIYYLNKITIDSFLYGVLDSVNPSPPFLINPILWYMMGYTTGYGAKTIYNKLNK